MITLIIPAAGSATLDGGPSCLARHSDGLYLFEKCMSGLDRKNIGRVIITILESDNFKYDIESKVLETFKNSSVLPEVFLLSETTNGPAETVYLTIKKMNVKGRIIIKDVDNFVSVSSLDYENFVVGIDVFDYDIHNLKTKSFITINEQSNVLDIIEKQIKSNYICVGCYGLKSSEDFLRAYEILNDPNYDIEKLYISHIITYLIGRYDDLFKYVKADNFESYDSQEEWDSVNYKKTTRHKIKYKLALFDFDGTLFNTNKVNYLAYKEAVEKFGYKFDYEYFLKNCVGRHYKDFLGDIGITDEKLLHDIHELKGQCYRKYLNCAEENTHLFAIIELIKPSYNVALVTTAARKNVEDILMTFDKMNVFDKIFTQEDVTKFKPDPECYFKAMKFFNASAEDTIVFEDSEVGLQAAKSSGANYYKVFGF